MKTPPFYPSNPSYHVFVVLCVLSTLCAKTCSWCTNGVLDRLSHDVRNFFFFFFYYYYGFCACLLVLAHSFIYIQNTCNKCASDAHVNQPRLWWTQPPTINFMSNWSPCLELANSVKKLARVNQHPLAHHTQWMVCADRKHFLCDILIP